MIKFEYSAGDHATTHAVDDYQGEKCEVYHHA